MALGSNLTKKESPLETEGIATDEISTKPDESLSDGNENSKEVETTQYCVFRSGTEFYGIPIDLVKEVVVSPASSIVPQMPKYITGMVNVRGNIYGVLDLKTFFQNEDKGEEEMKYLLLLDHEEYQMGILIPKVPDTISINDEDIENLPTSRLKSVIGQKYLKGIIKKDKRMIILFDILGMISGEKFTELG